MGSGPVACSKLSDFAPVLIKEFLDIQATLECRLTLKKVRDIIWTYSQMYRFDWNSQQSSIIWPIWLNGSMFVYEVSCSGFESSCSHLNVRLRACFEQGVPWHWGNYRVSIHSKKYLGHNMNTQSNTLYRAVLRIHFTHLAGLAKCWSVCLRTKCLHFQV